MTKDNAITLLLAEQHGLVTLDPYRKRDALGALNDAVYEIDKAEIVQMASGPALDRPAQGMDSFTVRREAQRAEHVATQIDAAKNRYEEIRERLHVRSAVTMDGPMLYASKIARSIGLDGIEVVRPTGGGASQAS